MNSITLLIHSTAATSAAAKIKKPIIETVKDNLYLRVYENNLLIFDFIIPDRSLFEYFDIQKAEDHPLI